MSIDQFDLVMFLAILFSEQGESKNIRNLFWVDDGFLALQPKKQLNLDLTIHVDKLKNVTKTILNVTST